MSSRLTLPRMAEAAGIDPGASTAAQLWRCIYVAVCGYFRGVMRKVRLHEIEQVSRGPGATRLV